MELLPDAADYGKLDCVEAAGTGQIRRADMETAVPFGAAAQALFL
jgi:hypothetical protein